MPKVFIVISANDAIHLIAEKFPDIQQELREDDGLIHLQIGSFCELVQVFIDSGDALKYKHACNLFVYLFRESDPRLINALNVSFLERLNFKDGKSEREWAYHAMPPLMKQAWIDMEEYNNKLRRKS